MTSIEQDALALAAQLSQHRREIAARSPKSFFQVYLAPHAAVSGSQMHDELFAMFQKVADDRGGRLAIAAPRGHAKSTVITLACVLWAVLCRGERFVIVVSATKELASQHLKHIRDELETNRMLQLDFPQSNPFGQGTRPKPWRGGALQLPSGALLKALGAGEQIRGIRHKESRPSLIVVDDLEVAETADSADARRKTRGWFDKTLLKSGDQKTNVVVIGTVVHYDSLLANLLDNQKSPGWESRKYKALISRPTDTALWTKWEDIFCQREQWDDTDGQDAARAFFRAHRDEMSAGAEVLWPQRESLYELMRIRVAEGRASFDSEKQNEPIDPEQCLFKPETLTYWDDEFKDVDTLRKALGTDAEFLAAWDPSMGSDPRRGDYSAIVVCAYERSLHRFHVVVADLKRRSPTEAIVAFVEYIRMYRINSIAVEANGFQEMLIDDLKSAIREARLGYVYINRVKNTSNKNARIASLEPMVTQGRVRFTRRHPEFLEQLRQFPLGAHDDGPDALQMLISAGSQPIAKI